MSSEVSQPGGPEHFEPAQQTDEQSAAEARALTPERGEQEHRQEVFNALRGANEDIHARILAVKQEAIIGQFEAYNRRIADMRRVKDTLKEIQETAKNAHGPDGKEKLRKAIIRHQGLSFEPLPPISPEVTQMLKELDEAGTMHAMLIAEAMDERKLGITVTEADERATEEDVMRQLEIWNALEDVANMILAEYPDNTGASSQSGSLLEKISSLLETANEVAGPDPNAVQLNERPRPPISAAIDRANDSVDLTDKYVESLERLEAEFASLTVRLDDFPETLEAVV